MPGRWIRTGSGERSMCTVNPSGRPLGIIGLGRIRQRIAQKARACISMGVVYNDVRRLPEAVERETETKCFEVVDDLLAVAGCVVTVMPFGGRKVLDAEKFSKVKKCSRLVNIARGKLIGEDALGEALEKGQLQSGRLDVHYDEPNVDPKLTATENVEVLFHNCGTSINGMMGVETMSMENILTYFETRKALTPDNLEYFEQSSS